MDASVVIAFACAVLAAVGTGVLVGRCIRMPRLDVIAWACAVAAITAALGAQALGAYHGYTSPTFRVVQLGAQLVAPLWLTWGLLELAAESVAARFGAKLVTAAVTVVGGVILITDPLSTAAFGTSWPPAAEHYQLIPKSLLSALAAVVAVAVVIMLIVAAVRLRNERAAARRLIAAAPVGVAALILCGLRYTLPSAQLYPVACALSAALAAWAGIRAVKLPTAGDFADDVYGAEGYAGDGDWMAEEDDDEPLVSSAATGGARAGQFGQDWPRQQAGGLQSGGLRPGGFPARDDKPLPPLPDQGGDDYRDDDWYRLDRGSQGNGTGEVNGGYPADGGSGPDGGNGMNGLRRNRQHRPAEDSYPGAGELPSSEEPAGLAKAGRTGVWQPRAMGQPTAAPGSELALPRAEVAPLTATGEMAATQRLYGLIAIYTLADGTEEEFDALAERVVAEVRASEPDALVYAVHSVPNAPMQRIFYEVYRDHTAYEEHKRHHYIQRFDVERGPFVLATNVIELGTQQAKLSPLPGLSQLFNGRPPGV